MSTQQEVLDTGARVVRRIIARRKQLDMSARMLAEAVTAAGLPLSRSTLANLESGRRGDITTTELVAFARALKTTPGDLLAPSPCAVCQDAPPIGFRCTACGVVGELPKASSRDEGGE